VKPTQSPVVTTQPPAGPDLRALLAAAEARPFTGWDFSWLEARMHTEPPWDYTAMVLGLAGRSPDLLDMGTGGGEWLRALPATPDRTVALEAWPPNVSIAGTNLVPRHVPVVQDEGSADNVDQIDAPARGRLPFRSASFHLVVNRHEAFNAREVGRVLRAGGSFLTQQVDHGAFDDAYPLLDRDVPVRRSDSWLDLAVEQLQAVGLTVIGSDRGVERYRFDDVAAFAWYLQSIPWSVPGFTIRGHRAQLARLHEAVCRGGSIQIRQPRFWVHATKPA
jgi:SAM-dependent methyltransferase